MTPLQTPISPYQKTLGMVFFARSLDKIRKNAAGTLCDDFRANLGIRLDGLLLNYLRIEYAELVKRTLEGGSDEEILQWCFERGRKLNELDIRVWNDFACKLGWNDAAHESLLRNKRENGLAHRDDIVTIFQFFEADEGRVVG